MLLEQGQLFVYGQRMLRYCLASGLRMIWLLLLLLVNHKLLFIFTHFCCKTFWLRCIMITIDSWTWCIGLVLKIINPHSNSWVWVISMRTIHVNLSTNYHFHLGWNQEFLQLSFLLIATSHFNCWHLLILSQFLISLESHTFNRCYCTLALDHFSLGCYPN